MQGKSQEKNQAAHSVIHHHVGLIVYYSFHVIDFIKKQRVCQNEMNPKS